MRFAMNRLLDLLEEENRSRSSDFQPGSSGFGIHNRGFSLAPSQDSNPHYATIGQIFLIDLNRCFDQVYFSEAARQRGLIAARIQRAVTVLRPFTLSELCHALSQIRLPAYFHIGGASRPGCLLWTPLVILGGLEEIPEVVRRTVSHQDQMGEALLSELDSIRRRAILLGLYEDRGDRNWLLARLLPMAQRIPLLMPPQFGLFNLSTKR